MLFMLVCLIFVTISMFTFRRVGASTPTLRESPLLLDYPLWLLYVLPKTIPKA